MKICPKCQQQFPNGFQYCPNDTEHLIANEEYLRRTKPSGSAPIIDPIDRPPASPIPPRNSEPFRSRETGPLSPEPPRAAPPRTEPVRPAQNFPRPDTPPSPQPPAGYGGNRAPQAPQQP